MRITAITQQVKRPGRYSVFVDGVFAFGLSEAALLESGLASGQELNAAQLRQLKKAANLDKLYGNALRYAALRPRSEGELQAYFRRKQVDEPAAKQVTERLKKLGFVNDIAFARSWVASRRALRAVSQRRLRLELQQKHISGEIIDSVLAEDETDDRTILTKLIAKKRMRYPDPQKLMAYLGRQGFSFDDIKAALQSEKTDG